MKLFSKLMILTALSSLGVGAIVGIQNKKPNNEIAKATNDTTVYVSSFSIDTNPDAAGWCYAFLKGSDELIATANNAQMINERILDETFTFFDKTVFIDRDGSETILRDILDVSGGFWWNHWTRVPGISFKINTEFANSWNASRVGGTFDGKTLMVHEGATLPSVGYSMGTTDTKDTMTVGAEAVYCTSREYNVSGQYHIIGDIDVMSLTQNISREEAFPNTTSIQLGFSDQVDFGESSYIATGSTVMCNLSLNGLLSSTLYQNKIKLNGKYLWERGYTGDNLVQHTYFNPWVQFNTLELLVPKNETISTLTIEKGTLIADPYDIPGGYASNNDSLSKFESLIGSAYRVSKTVTFTLNNKGHLVIEQETEPTLARVKSWDVGYMLSLNLKDFVLPQYSEETPYEQIQNESINLVDYINENNLILRDENDEIIPYTLANDGYYNLDGFTFSQRIKNEDNPNLLSEVATIELKAGLQIPGQPFGKISQSKLINKGEHVAYTLKNDHVLHLNNKGTFGKEVTIKFGDSEVSAIVGGTVEAPAVPTKPQTAEFVYSDPYWKNIETEAAFDPNAIVTGPAIYAASYTEERVPYELTYLDIDGNKIDDLGGSIANGSSVTMPDVPTVPGYTSTGWECQTSGFEVVGNSFIMPTQNVTFIATYEAESYLLSFDGTDYTKAVTYNQPIGDLPEIPQKEGHTPKSWLLNGETIDENTIYTLTTGAIAYADYDVNYYDVTFVLDNGEDNIVKTYAYNSLIELPEDPVKEGYTFAYWMYQDEEFIWNTRVSGDMTIYAYYQINIYEVVFDTDGGTPVKSQAVKHGDKAIRPEEDPIKEGGEFIGWYVGDEIFNFDTPITSDLTIYARYKRDNYVITFDTDGGTVVASQTVAFGNKVERPEDPSKTGYTFAGWFVGDNEYNFDTVVNHEFTITAKWTINYYNVVFDSDFGSSVESQSIAYNQCASMPEDPVKEGYTFVGWFLESGEEFDFNTPITEDITLYAEWSIVSYIVTFDSKGGNYVDSQTVNYGTTASRPEDPVKEGYNFVGWYDEDDNLFDFTSKIYDDITLHAEWEIMTFTVTFDTDGGTAIASQTINYGLVVEQPADPTKDGYTFVGWYVGDEIYDFSTPVTGDLLISARWEEIIVESSSEDSSIIEESSEIIESSVTSVSSSKISSEEVSTSSNSQDEPTRNGCGGSIAAASALISLISITGVVLISKKRK